MADDQHNAIIEERDRLTLAFAEPAARFGTEWSVWVDYAGAHDPVTSDTSFMVGYGRTREEAAAMAARTAAEGLRGIHWNILGQVYTPMQVSAESFAWHALLPAETFVPPHIHPTQDEFVLVLEGTLDAVLDGQARHAAKGDLLIMPRGICR